MHVARGRTFALALGRPARFELLASDAGSARPGDVVDVDEEVFSRLPPLLTSLPGEGGGGAEVSVTVEGEVTPIGTLELACVTAGGPPSSRFRLAFQLRAEPTPSVHAATASAKAPQRRDSALDLLDRAFGKPRPDAGPRTAKDLLRDLERVLGERARWTTETNRALFDALVPNARARRRSPDHERVFWLLAGFCIRPGFGDPRDASRLSELAPLFEEKLAFVGEVRGWQQFFIAWRRASGGLDESTQTAIRDFIDPFLAPADTLRRPKKAPLALDDGLEMASLLERVPPPRRAALGDWVLERTWTDRDPRLWSALGRLGARIPAYASIHCVVPPQVAERWLEHLLREKWGGVPTAVAAAVALARKTGDRARDIRERIRSEVEERLLASGAAPQQLRAVREVVAVEESDRVAFFGDSLPLGLRLID
jgi:hypothetical protein